MTTKSFICVSTEGVSTKDVLHREQPRTFHIDKNIFRS